MTDSARQTAPTLTSLRTRAVALAESYIGLDAGADPDAYLSLVGPWESQQVRRGMLQMSGCALFCRGLLRQLGVDHDVLEQPYRVGRAVADVVQIAREADAWRVPSGTSDDMPGLGDCVLVGGGTPGEHVFVVVGTERVMPGRWRVTSVDGGQKTETGDQMIQRIEREWTVLPGATWDHRSTPPPSVRRVSGWVDVERVVSVFGAASFV